MSVTLNTNEFTARTSSFEIIKISFKAFLLKRKVFHYGFSATWVVTFSLHNISARMFYIMVLHNLVFCKIDILWLIRSWCFSFRIARTASRSGIMTFVFADTRKRATINFAAIFTLLYQQNIHMQNTALEWKRNRKMNAISMHHL